MNVNENEEGIISDSFGLRAKIFLFITPKNMVRELFRFGAGSKKITSQNEKNLVPLCSANTRRNRSVCGAYFGRRGLRILPQRGGDEGTNP